MDERETIGTRLRELRKNMRPEPEKVSCEQVVRELYIHQHFKLSREALDKFERDQRVPNGDAVVALADYYGVTTDYLLGYSPIKNTADQLQITAFTLGLSLSATEQLVHLCELQGSRTADILSAILESPELDDTLKALVASQNGIDRQRKHIQDILAKKPHGVVDTFVDMAEMFVLRSTKQIQKLLKDVLGYNELCEEAADGEHTED